MNHRERVLAALRHEEPDRVPIDFGGTEVSTIMAVAYVRLREYLGLGPGKLRVAGPNLTVFEIEDDVRQALGSDVKFVPHEAKEWRQGLLPDGSPAELPARFLPQRQDDGSEVTFDDAGNVVLKMPEGGYWFDTVYAPLAGATSAREVERYVDTIEKFDKPDYHDKSYAELAAKAKWLYENTEYLLVGMFAGRTLQAGQFLRGWEQFLVDLLCEPEIAQAILEHLTQAHMRRFARFAETIGPYVQVVLFEDDLGMQDRTLLRPEHYRELVKPYHERLFRFAKSRCDAFLLLHTDGAIVPLIPDLIEMGVDALNPVQVSAAGMDSRELKREFGRDVTFWGGGCDSQHVLPFGAPQAVRDEVKRRIDDLAPGGGYVFAGVHNVQVDVPPENVVAMFETAREYGVYGRQAICQRKNADESDSHT